MKNPIETFFAPLSRDQFLEHYISNTPLLAQVSQEHMSALHKNPLLSSKESLFENWQREVNAYMPGLPDEVNSAKVPPELASKLFSEGTGLFFDNPNEVDESIHNILISLQRDLGLSEITFSRSLIYLIAEGHGTAAHFDQNINFIYQVSGTKRWWIAKNTEIQNPMSRFTIGSEMDPELASYANCNPSEFPNDAKEYLLEPGSILFLPRGAWHTTEAESDALSLNFTFSAPTWIDLLTTAMRARLSQSSIWRETASFVTDKDRLEDQSKKFDMLIDSIASDMKNWNALDILKTTEMDKLPLD